MINNAFERLSPFIQDYIYRNRWTEMRDIQVAACEVIFDTNSNLLLGSGTASGKTEAAFLPVLTDLYNNPSSTIGVLYISPLKSLINDQFYRLTDLLQEVEIPVTKWHGDVDQKIKNKILQHPAGVLQTTPESLEAMLMKRKSEALKLFADLRYVIIDEVHYFMDNERGIQLLCILERLQNLTNTKPRRVGLSATLSDYSSAEQWLNSGTERNCITPKIKIKSKKLRLSVEHFPITDNPKDDNISIYYKYLYDITLGGKSIVFANSRGEVEEIIAHLKQISLRSKSQGNYYVHHGSISASLREFAERKMKEAEGSFTTGATVTLELGIDIGALDRIIQIGSPFSVSSFVQRLGRSGRRGNPAEIWFAFPEFSHNDSDFYKKVNWNFVKCIALIQLYLEEQWIEPISKKTLPYSILYHQTMSQLASMGEVSIPLVAQNNLSLSAFKNISKDDYRQLLKHLIEIDQIELSERNGILIGVEGEKEINNYEFYAVFESPIEYIVKNGSEEIGSVQRLHPVGDRFALAGKTWEVLEINKKSWEIYVKEIKGVSYTNWFIPVYNPIHTKVVKKMQEVILSQEVYKYLGDKAIIRLDEIRQTFKLAGADKNMIVRLNEDTLCLIPWIGTKAMRALSYGLDLKGYPNNLEGFCIIIRTKSSSLKLIEILKEIKSKPLDKYDFNIPEDAQTLSKYNKFIPEQLLRKQYIEDYIDVDDMKSNLFV